MTNVVFEACDLRDADFSNARASNVAFVDCSVRGAKAETCAGLTLAMRQWLSDNGAVVDMAGVTPRREIDPRETVKELLRKVLGKFRYDASKMESTLVRGIALEDRYFVKDKIIKRLVNFEYLTVIDRGKASPVIYIRNNKKNPEVWQLVDNGHESKEIRELIDALVKE